MRITPPRASAVQRVAVLLGQDALGPLQVVTHKRQVVDRQTEITQGV